MKNSSFLERQFKLSENSTTIKTEVLAGITTFMTMAYILVVNPVTLSDAGMDFGAVFTATAIASIVGIMIMAFVANLPFALAPGMGLNAFFAYYVVQTLGYPWQMALAAVLIEGVIFIILTFLNVREAIINSIPLTLKKAVSVGIGLFIALIGLANAKVIVPGSGVIVELGNIKSGDALLAMIGIVITGILLARRVKGALFIGILITTIIGFPMGITKLPESILSAPPSLAPTFAQFDFTHLFTLDMVVIVFTFLFVDLFDTVGTLVGVATKANMLDQAGKVPRAKQALLADAVGTTVGAVLGTSTVTTYVESAAGVAEGGRTGLTSLTTGVLFVVALLFSPIFIMIPSAATAPALVLVGLFMLSPVKEIPLDDYTEAIPAFLAIIMMPLTYSISEGIVFGILSYVLIKIFTGKAKEVSLLMYIVALLFLIQIYVG